MLLRRAALGPAARRALQASSTHSSIAATSHRLVLPLPSSIPTTTTARRGIYGRGGSGGGGVPGQVGGSSSSVPARTKEEETALATPIDFDIQSKIEGAETQIVVVDLEPNQILRAETGAMLYMTEGVEIETSLGGGLGDAAKRYMTGQNVFISDFKYKGEGGHGTVCLGTDFPSKVMRLSLAEHGGALVCQKGAFLAANHTVGIEMEMARTFKAGFFGGEGFVLQRLTGDGDVFVKAGGALIRRELQPGETLRVTSGAIVGFSPSVQYDVQMMKGVKNVMFGGEGLFVTTLTGPGTVYLQSMPMDKMIGAIASRVPGGGPGLAFGVPLGMGGGAGGGEGEAGAEGGGGGDVAEGAGEASSAASAGAAHAATGAGVGGGQSIWDSGNGNNSGGGGGSEAAQQHQQEQGGQRAEEVWREEEGGDFEGEGGEDVGEAASEAASGIGGVVQDIWDMFK